MKLADINPFMRYAALQPSVLSSAPLCCSYDYRLFYIIDGEANLVLEHSEIKLFPGTLVYFRPATPYYFDGSVKVIVLNFDLTREHSDLLTPIKPSKTLEAFIPEMVTENNPPEELCELIAVRAPDFIEEKVRECLKHYCYPTPLSDTQTSALIKEILAFAAKSSTPEENGGAFTPELVQKINLFIRQNYDKELSNSELSSEFGYHSFYLNRRYKESTGITLHQAVLRQRIHIAKRLLKSTSLSISKISSEVGFPSRSQFCTAFKKFTGTTPLEYKKGLPG